MSRGGLPNGARTAAALAVAIMLGIAGGVAVAAYPVLAAALVIGAAVATLALRMPARLPVLFLRGLAVILMGYACLGRTFAYLGYPPLFLGEVVLLVGAAAIVLTPLRRHIVRSPLAAAIGLFILWGALRTIPFIRSMGIDALRDGVIWGYSAFALVAAAALVETGRVPAMLGTYARAIPFFLLLLPVSFALAVIVGDGLPTLPWADVPVVTFKAGDMGVHLAGVAVFTLLGLREASGVRGARTKGVMLLLLWLGGCIIATSQSRGAAIAILAALGVAAVLHPRRFGARLAGAAAMSLVVVAAAVAILVLAPPVPSPRLQTERGVSLSQVADNLRSISGSRYRSVLDTTREWRLEWWSDIVDYTVFGRYFWGGRGFGVNLADEDGFQVAADRSLRSPHSIHLTVLARAGVPGLALWVLLNGSFLVTMLTAHRKARAAGQERWARAGAWLLAYWAALLVNASFDVFIEGPQGGIWFWSVMGAGMAVMETARRERRLRPAGGRTWERVS